MPEFDCNGLIIRGLYRSRWNKKLAELLGQVGLGCQFDMYT